MGFAGLRWHVPADDLAASGPSICSTADPDRGAMALHRLEASPLLKFAMATVLATAASFLASHFMFRRIPLFRNRVSRTSRRQGAGYPPWPVPPARFPGFTATRNLFPPVTICSLHPEVSRRNWISRGQSWVPTREGYQFPQQIAVFCHTLNLPARRRTGKQAFRNTTR